MYRKGLTATSGGGDQGKGGPPPPGAARKAKVVRHLRGR
jgi:hypothetical protein